LVVKSNKSQLGTNYITLLSGRVSAGHPGQR